MSHTAKTSSTRSFIAVLGSALAVLTLAATPALAAAGYQNVGRHLELSGDRDLLRVVGQVTNPSPDGSFVVKFGLGTDAGGEFIQAELAQDGQSKASRAVKAFASGTFQNAEGQNCDVGDFYASCRRGGYNWVADRDYRIVLNRGDRNEELGGRLWTLKIVDTETGKAEKLLSMRSQQDRLTPTANLAQLDLHPEDCANINTFAAVVQKPEGSDATTVRWGEAQSGWDGDVQCKDAARTATVSAGSTKLKISN